MRAYRAGNVHALAISEVNSGLFAVKGDLTFTTINQHTLKAIDCSLSDVSIRIDLQEVATTDSAGLALMIEWLKISKKHSGKLSFINIPLQLQALAKISGFDQNLSLTLQTDEQSNHKAQTQHHG
ncbi:MAG: STAS domain-containing protein [Methylococcaceae bacterium]|nr:STAS domain-containing protein [Methylococcaceae bacterium]